jgi:mRNA-degrading endonuclease HigB of HigAB toxin-antitoxin module
VGSLVKLIDIKSLVQKVADAISSVLNMDVIISDNEFNKIADTKKHFNLEVEYIKDNYILGKVIQSGEVKIIEGIV